MAKKTLITFVGLGKPEGGGYIKTTYDFGENKHITSSCFAEAIRQSGKFAFDEVLFVGTATSSWSSLLESVEEQADLWENLYSREIDKQPLTDELQKDLHTALEQIWQKPVRISINPKDLTPENCNEILNKYIAEIFNSGSDILLDVTHSFRWMPLLLSSALQFRNAYSGPGGEKGNIEIVYGEFGDKLSPVRHLDVWRESEEISDAIALFFQKFEAEPLAEKLAPHWSGGAKIISKLSNHIQGCYFLPLLTDVSTPGFHAGQPLNQLGNTLANFNAENAPEWVKRVHTQLNEFYNRLNVDDSARRLINMARLLAERKLFGQAILSICLAAEQSLMMAFGRNEHPGFEELQNLKAEYSNKVGKYSRNDKLLFDILAVRNQVAHGGLGKDKVQAPLQISLASRYADILKKYEQLHTFLQNDFNL